LLLFAVAAAATGQVLLKNGMRTASTRGSEPRVAGCRRAVAVGAGGLAVFGISAVAWLAVLSRCR
jgi:hypothetical protein